MRQKGSEKDDKKIKELEKELGCLSSMSLSTFKFETKICLQSNVHEFLSNLTLISQLKKVKLTLRNKRLKWKASSPS